MSMTKSKFQMNVKCQSSEGGGHKIRIGREISLFGMLDLNFIPAAGDHGLWPWRIAPSLDRDVAPQGR